MYQLIKKSLTSKNFYSDGYKSISRAKTFAYVFIVCLLFAFFTSPITTVKSYKSFFSLKEQVAQLSSDVEIKYDTENGLETNLNSPLIFEIEKDAYLVVDSNANYKPKGEGSHEVVFRNKGYMVYQNGELASQTSYSLPKSMQFRLDAEYLKTEFNSVSNSYIILVLVITNIFGNFLGSILNLLIMAVMFGSMSFMVNRFFLKEKATLLQSYKRMLFLGVYFLAGMAINTVLGSTYAIFDVVLLGIGYFWLVK